MGRDVIQRWLECLGAIKERDRRGEKGLKADFAAVGGSGTKGDRLVQEMSESHLVEEVQTSDGPRYTITRLGVLAYLMFLARDDLGPFWDYVGRIRARKRGNGE